MVNCQSTAVIQLLFRVRHLGPSFHSELIRKKSIWFILPPWRAYLLRYTRESKLILFIMKTWLDCSPSRAVVWDRNRILALLPCQYPSRQTGKVPQYFLCHHWHWFFSSCNWSHPSSRDWPVSPTLGNSLLLQLHHNWNKQKQYEYSILNTGEYRPHSPVLHHLGISILVVFSLELQTLLVYTIYSMFLLTRLIKIHTLIHWAGKIRKTLLYTVSLNGYDCKFN